MRVPLFSIGINKRNNKEANRPTTPPSLFGTVRKIAYANKKYHSGTICEGVDNGLARMKLSGSPRRFGIKRTSLVITEVMTTKPTRSLIEKYQ